MTEYKKDYSYIGFCVVFVLLLIFTIGIGAHTVLDNQNNMHNKEIFCIKNGYDTNGRTQAPYLDYCITDNITQQFVTIDDEYRFIK